MSRVKGKSYEHLGSVSLKARFPECRFLDQYNDPANYRPEAHRSNRSRRHD